MGYKVDLILEDGVSGAGLTKQVTEEYLQGKTIKDIIEDMLNTATGTDKHTAGTIRTLYRPETGGFEIFRGLDNRPIQIGDLVTEHYTEIEEIGERKGKLHLIVQKANIIG